MAEAEPKPGTTEPIVVDTIWSVGLTITPSAGGGPDDVVLNLVAYLTEEQLAAMGLEHGATIAPQPPLHVTITFPGPPPGIGPPEVPLPTPTMERHTPPDPAPPSQGD